MVYTFIMKKSFQSPLRILITGASGFIGAAVTHALAAQGHTLIILARTQKPGTLFWDPTRLQIDEKALHNLDAVIHLAGEPVFGWWSASKKKRIFLTRVQGTRFLCERLLKHKKKPCVWVGASAVGYYGYGPFDHYLTEDDPQGNGFLANVCGHWEAATKLLESEGTRVVHLRFGDVLGRQGGVLKKMLPLFQAGLGTYIGNKDQRLSWIALHDVVRMVKSALTDPGWAGPINAVAPHPTKNIDFAQTLASVLDKPLRVHLPPWLLRTFGGLMARELLLADHPVKPQKLQALGFRYAYPELENALKA